MPKLFDAYGRPITVDRSSWIFTHRLVGGDLTSDGIQWSTEVPTVAADEDKEVLSLTLDNDQVGNIASLTFGLTMAIKAGWQMWAPRMWRIPGAVTCWTA